MDKEIKRLLSEITLQIEELNLELKCSGLDVKSRSLIDGVKTTLNFIRDDYLNQLAEKKFFESDFDDIEDFKEFEDLIDDSESFEVLDGQEEFIDLW